MRDLSEHEIQTQIKRYMGYKGWYVMRLNSGRYSIGEGRNKRFVMGQSAGTPDLQCFKEFKHKDKDGIEMITCELVFIEVKTPKNKPTRLQELKMEELEKYGAQCYIFHSLDECQKYF